jgi:hypothetical protein
VDAHPPTTVCSGRRRGKADRLTVPCRIAPPEQAPIPTNHPHPGCNREMSLARNPTSQRR